MCVTALQQSSCLFLCKCSGNLLSWCGWQQPCVWSRSLNKLSPPMKHFITGVTNSSCSHQRSVQTSTGGSASESAPFLCQSSVRRVMTVSRNQTHVISARNETSHCTSRATSVDGFEPSVSVSPRLQTACAELQGLCDVASQSKQAPQQPKGQ